MSTETVLRSSGVYTTVLGALNQFQALTDLNYTNLPNTTLNYKYRKDSTSVIHVQTPPFTPALSYFGIGTRGFVNVGDYSSVAYPGDARMLDLYNPIPIRCIPVSEENDPSIFPKSERDKYRLRVVREYNDIEYALYYLKKIEFNPNIAIRQKDINGEETDYAFDEMWLTPPTPNVSEIGGRIDTNINRLIVRASGTCEVRHDEIKEAVNVIYNGDTNYFKISEIGYYTGCDVDVTDEWVITNSSDDAKFKEAVFVQLAKGHCFRGSELSTPGSFITPVVSLESESCINGEIV